MTLLRAFIVVAAGHSGVGEEEAAARAGGVGRVDGEDVAGRAPRRREDAREGREEGAGGRGEVLARERGCRAGVAAVRVRGRPARGEALAEVREEQRAAARDGVAEELAHGLEERVEARALLGAAARGVDEVVRDAVVRGRPEHGAARGSAVAAGAAELLVERLERERRAVADHRAHVRRVDPHPERARRDHNAHPSLPEALVRPLALLRIHLPVVCCHFTP